jgi:hypothetical protein
MAPKSKSRSSSPKPPSAAKAAALAAAAAAAAAADPQLVAANEISNTLNAMIQIFSTISETLQSWPASEDEAMHAMETTTLGNYVNSLVKQISSLEDETLKRSAVKEIATNTKIPTDILDLLDIGANGFNPELFSAELLKHTIKMTKRAVSRKRALLALGTTMAKQSAAAAAIAVGSQIKQEKGEAETASAAISSSSSSAAESAGLSLSTSSEALLASSSKKRAGEEETPVQ